MDANQISHYSTSRSPFHEGPGTIGYGVDSLKRKPIEDQLGPGKRLREADSSTSKTVRIGSYAVADSNNSNKAAAALDDEFPPLGHGLLGDVVNDLDQTQEDELSQINWSQGRRRGPQGLYTCILDRRRQRAQDGGAPALKKKVRFVSEDKLVKVQHFQLEEGERQNVYTSGQPVFGVDIKKSSAQLERRELEHAQEENSHRKEMFDETPWYTPILLTGLPPPLVVRGKDSVEKVVFIARQSGSLSTLLHNREDLPDNPEEPPESLVPKGSHFDQFKLIPLLRVGMDVSQPLSLVPRGPLAEMNTVVAPPTLMVVPPPVQTVAPPQSVSVNGLSPFMGNGQPSVNGVFFPSTVRTVPEPVVERPEITVDLLTRLLKSHADASRKSNPPPLSNDRGPVYQNVAPYIPPPVGHSYNPALQPEVHSATRYAPSTQQFQSSQQGPYRPSAQDTRPSWNASATPSQGQYSSGYTSNQQQGTRNGGGQAPPRRGGKRICSYYKLPNGCRHGSACTFSHDPNY